MNTRILSQPRKIRELATCDRPTTGRGGIVLVTQFLRKAKLISVVGLNGFG